MTEVWAAPLAIQPLAATVPIPGSKSITNRAAVLAALASEPSVIRRPLLARDTALMVDGLRAMGTGIDETDDAWTITPTVLSGQCSVHVGNAGTVMRFLPSLACLAKGSVLFDGDESARRRPLSPVITALRTAGAEIEQAGAGSLPMTVHGTGRLAGGEVSLDASASSQFVSALVLAAPRFDAGISVRHVGPRMPSMPHIAMTVAMLRAAGAVVDDSVPSVWTVSPGRLQGRDIEVEPDLSNAAPFLAAALVTGGRVTIPGWPPESVQPGAALIDLLAAMGAEVRFDGEGLTLTGTGAVHGLDADLHDVGELTPVLAAVAVLADSPSHLHGIAHLRGHETDRLAALARELGGLGARVRETGDGLLIEPSSLLGGVFHTYEDHRLATSAAVLGLVVPGVQVVDIATTAKTMPGFVSMWTAMLGGTP